MKHSAQHNQFGQQTLFFYCTAQWQTRNSHLINLFKNTTCVMMQCKKKIIVLCIVDSLSNYFTSTNLVDPHQH